MSKPRSIASLIILLACLASQAFGVARPADVRIEGQGERYWVCLVTQDPNDANASTSSVRELADKASGRWTQIAQLQTQVIDVAAVGDRLALLNATGDWQLVWKGGSVIGPALPEGRVATRIAGNGESLLAITRAKETPELASLYHWTQSTGWSKLADLPEGATTQRASVAAYDGQPWIAYANGKTVRVARLEGTSWTPVCTLDESKEFELISGAPAAMLAWHGSGGRVSVWDVHTNRPLIVQSKEIPDPSDAAVVDTSLRFVYTSDGVTISQIGFDQYGKGAEFGPDTVAKLDANPQREREWINVVVVGLLTLAMLATFRQRPETTPAEAEHASKLVIAPLSRRIPAGVIDAIPFLISSAWVMNRMSAGGITADQVSLALYMPELIGMAVYILHVTLAEILFGRSIGKLMFGLRVVTAEAGTRVPAGRIVLRNILRVLDLLLFIPIFFILISPNGQRIGDLAARTLVVQDDSLEAQPIDVEEPTDVEPPAAG